ncbi:hypothetical protein HELRODRAFT_160625 [Helobdella robusta]|uniref:Uncharacterized protein n=1 Tax=Helobdella robusta TaxID=6412 RepID=T1EQI4_HELRO|nr:hypothetical protein HELRODRAFT_160625 [Helobdella robusta]ESO06453.1 hypothetical protein HELRODRAFT_160625 [Helobdella robusta]
MAGHKSPKKRKTLSKNIRSSKNCAHIPVNNLNDRTVSLTPYNRYFYRQLQLPTIPFNDVIVNSEMTGRPAIEYSEDSVSRDSYTMHLSKNDINIDKILKYAKKIKGMKRKIKKDKLFNSNLQKRKKHKKIPNSYFQEHQENISSNQHRSRLRRRLFQSIHDKFNRKDLTTSESVDDIEQSFNTPNSISWLCELAQNSKIASNSLKPAKSNHSDLAPNYQNTKYLKKGYFKNKFDEYEILPYRKEDQSKRNKQNALRKLFGDENINYGDGKYEKISKIIKKNHKEGSKMGKILQQSKHRKRVDDLKNVEVKQKQSSSHHDQSVRRRQACHNECLLSFNIFAVLLNFIVQIFFGFTSVFRKSESYPGNCCKQFFFIPSCHCFDHSKNTSLKYYCRNNSKRIVSNVRSARRRAREMQFDKGYEATLSDEQSQVIEHSKNERLRTRKKKNVQDKAEKRNSYLGEKQQTRQLYKPASLNDKLSLKTASQLCSRIPDLILFVLSTFWKIFINFIYFIFVINQQNIKSNVRKLPNKPYANVNSESNLGTRQEPNNMLTGKHFLNSPHNIDRTLNFQQRTNSGHNIGRQIKHRRYHLNSQKGVPESHVNEKYIGYDNREAVCNVCYQFCVTPPTFLCNNPAHYEFQLPVNNFSSLQSALTLERQHECHSEMTNVVQNHETTEKENNFPKRPIKHNLNKQFQMCENKISPSKRKSIENFLCSLTRKRRESYDSICNEHLNICRNREKNEDNKKRTNEIDCNKESKNVETTLNQVEVEDKIKKIPLISYVETIKAPEKTKKNCNTKTEAQNPKKNDCVKPDFNQYAGTNIDSAIHSVKNKKLSAYKNRGRNNSRCRKGRPSRRHLDRSTGVNKNKHSESNFEAEKCKEQLEIKSSTRKIGRHKSCLSNKCQQPDCVIKMSTPKCTKTVKRPAKSNEMMPKFYSEQVLTENQRHLLHLPTKSQKRDNNHIKQKMLSNSLTIQSSSPDIIERVGFSDLLIFSIDKTSHIKKANSSNEQIPNKYFPDDEHFENIQTNYFIEDKNDRPKKVVQKLSTFSNKTIKKSSNSWVDKMSHNLTRSISSNVSSHQSFLQLANCQNDSSLDGVNVEARESKLNEIFRRSKQQLTCTNITSQIQQQKKRCKKILQTCAVQPALAINQQNEDCCENAMDQKLLIDRNISTVSKLKLKATSPVLISAASSITIKLAESVKPMQDASDQGNISPTPLIVDVCEKKTEDLHEQLLSVRNAQPLKTDIKNSEKIKKDCLSNFFSENNITNKKSGSVNSLKLLMSDDIKKLREEEKFQQNFLSYRQQRLQYHREQQEHLLNHQQYQMLEKQCNEQQECQQTQQRQHQQHQQHQNEEQERKQEQCEEVQQKQLRDQKQKREQLEKQLNAGQQQQQLLTTFLKHQQHQHQTLPHQNYSFSTNLCHLKQQNPLRKQTQKKQQHCLQQQQQPQHFQKHQHDEQLQQQNFQKRQCQQQRQEQQRSQQQQHYYQQKHELEHHQRFQHPETDKKLKSRFNHETFDRSQSFCHTGNYHDEQSKFFQPPNERQTRHFYEESKNDSLEINPVKRNQDRKTNPSNCHREKELQQQFENLQLIQKQQFDQILQNQFGPSSTSLQNVSTSHLDLKQRKRPNYQNQFPVSLMSNTDNITNKVINPSEVCFPGHACLQRSPSSVVCHNRKQFDICSNSNLTSPSLYQINHKTKHIAHERTLQYLTNNINCLTSDNEQIKNSVKSTDEISKKFSETPKNQTTSFRFSPVVSTTLITSASPTSLITTTLLSSLPPKNEKSQHSTKLKRKMLEKICKIALSPLLEIDDDSRKYDSDNRINDDTD